MALRYLINLLVREGRVQCIPKTTLPGVSKGRRSLPYPALRLCAVRRPGMIGLAAPSRARFTSERCRGGPYAVVSASPAVAPLLGMLMWKFCRGISATVRQSMSATINDEMNCMLTICIRWT